MLAWFDLVAFGLVTLSNYLAVLFGRLGGHARKCEAAKRLWDYHIRPHPYPQVFVDQAYWQSAIAAKPSATHRGYILGGICWFAIPFTLATSMGIAALALDLPI